MLGIVVDVLQKQFLCTDIATIVMPPPQTAKIVIATLVLHALTGENEKVMDWQALVHCQRTAVVASRWVAESEAFSMHCVCCKNIFRWTECRNSA